MALNISGILLAQTSPATRVAATTTGAAGTSRALTQGEIALARSIFGEEIDYTKVKVVHKKWAVFQGKDALMTPNGNIYSHPNGYTYSSDYSTVKIRAYSSEDLIYTHGIFLHEMTHVWQHQKGMWVKTRRFFHSNYYYDFDTFGTRDFKSYGIEEQAQIVEDYYRLLHGGEIIRYDRPVPYYPVIPIYRRVLKKHFP